MIQGRHFQNAYVTRDRDAALEHLQARADVRQVITYEGTTPVWTPGGQGEQTSRLAFVWVEDLQVELIQPVSGLVDIYRDALPPGDGLQFHHVCMRVDDWGVFRAQVDEQPFPVVMEGGGEALRFIYLDARSLLGHYIEYTWMVDERWTQMGGR